MDHRKALAELKAHLQGLIDLIVEGTPMRVSAEDCFLETEVVMAVQRSADEREGLSS